MKKSLIYLIKKYQKLAPKRIRNACRFEPTCSRYAIQAINKYGIFKGCFLSAKRLLRCRPPLGGSDRLQ